MSAPAAEAPPRSRIESEVLRTRALIEKREFAPALTAAQRLLAEVPENRDVLYLAAVSERYLGRIADALRTLARCEQIHPDYGRLFQERGHCLRAVGEGAAAVEAYRQAVSRNHTLVASWQALAELSRARGEAAEADIAAAHVKKLSSLPAPVVQAANMLCEGELYPAEQVLRRFLRSHGDHIEAMRLLAQIGVRHEVLDDAEFLLESVLTFAPDYRAARCDYVHVLSLRHKHARALEEAEKLLAAEPHNPALRTLHANALVGLGRYEEALEVFRDLLPGAARPADLHLSIAHALKTLGRQSEAIEAYRGAAAARPGFGDAYWSLANLKTYRFTDAELAAMRAHEAQRGAGRADRYHLCFALGKALEDGGEYGESFAYYARGNALKKTEVRYRPEPLERTLRAQASVCTREFFAARSGSGCPPADPIFIVGLPRAGSTLIEQILASHSRIEGTMELAEVPRIAAHLNGREVGDAPPRYPQILAQLEPERLARLGEKYLTDTKVYRTGKPFFIDKMPNNFRHVGLIHLMLPQAKILDARREPMACCFGNFKQLFASGQEFTYDLTDIARYYRAYVDVMAHWERVLPGKVLRVQHEELVQDFEPQVRRMLDFLGVDFEPACLEFHKTERSVRTASSEQVRRPIYRQGLDQWRHFAPWLGPLRAALGELAPVADPGAAPEPEPGVIPGVGEPGAGPAPATGGSR